MSIYEIRMAHAQNTFKHTFYINCHAWKRKITEDRKLQWLNNIVEPISLHKTTFSLLHEHNTNSYISSYI